MTITSGNNIKQKYMRYLVSFFVFCFLNYQSYGCTTFMIEKDNRFYFGRNYDFATGNGIIVTNRRGQAKRVSDSLDGLQWTSRYGSLTFNQFGKDFPQGGMNEKGLVVELMWLDDTRYPSPDARPGVGGLQWIQYQLDNSATIEDVILTDKIVRIDGSKSAPLHFLIADAGGNAATIEFLYGKMVIHKGGALKYPVLTNSTYSKALVSKDTKSEQAFTDNSLARFLTACSMLDHYKQSSETADPVDYGFLMLEKVAQKDFTRWSIVYDISAGKIIFNSKDAREKKEIKLSDFDFSCNGPVLALDININLKGNVRDSFAELSYDHNKAVIERSALECRSVINIGEAMITSHADYFNLVNCR